MLDRDPIFDAPTPILFAHRGGAREKPESTEMAFDWAVHRARADVLEMDVQMTKDDVIVLWHGPDLDNVRIEGVPSEIRTRKRLGKRKTDDFTWAELDGKAWVADPHAVGNDDPTAEELDAVPTVPGRTMLRLTDFLEHYPDHHINLEIKPETFSPPKVQKLARILDQHWSANRRILVTSREKGLLEAFRGFATREFPAGYSFWSVLRMTFLPSPFGDMTGRALQTTYVKYFSRESLVQKVEHAGGAVHVFLTGFWPFKGLDEIPPSPADLKKILDRGVHGIMTDRPQHVRGLM